MTCTKLISDSRAYETVDFKAYRGNDFDRDIEFYEADGTTPQTGFMDSTFKMQVKKQGLNEMILEFTEENGFTKIAPNILRVNKTAEQMLIPAGTYNYDLQQTNLDGEIITSLKGKFELENNVTDSN